jgi:hypothetical protein
MLKHSLTIVLLTMVIITTSMAKQHEDNEVFVSLYQSNDMILVRSLVQPDHPVIQAEVDIIRSNSQSKDLQLSDGQITHHVNSILR